MQWFEGDIGQAISMSKEKNAIFVVYVYGNDDASKNTFAAIDAPEVSSKLNNNDFVAVKLESGSQPYHQFAQIYQVVPVPSLFFIGENGVPLVVVPGSVSSSTLLEHIGKLKPSKIPAEQQGPSTSRAPEQKMDVSQESTPPVSENVSESSTTSNTSSSDPKELLEDRMKRAEKARAELAAKRLREEQERDKDLELNRRKQGQEIAQAKKAREALEAQQALDERKRERELEREARERVLKQIAQDKQERAARLAAEKSATSSAPAASSPAPTLPKPSAAMSSTSTRLQFRLPDGSSNTQVFEAQSLLQDVRNYVRTTLNPGSFTLSMAFPRTELTTADDKRNLADLNLVPSAALLIVPASSSSGSVAPAGPGLSAFLMLLLSPFTFLWSFVSSYIWGGPSAPATGSAGQSAGQQGESQAASAASARARNTQNEAIRQRFRREGNIHRLAGSSDNDDENNTYNGNSTQQM